MRLIVEIRVGGLLQAAHQRSRRPIGWHLAPGTHLTQNRLLLFVGVSEPTGCHRLAVHGDFLRRRAAPRSATVALGFGLRVSIAFAIASPSSSLTADTASRARCA